MKALLVLLLGLAAMPGAAASYDPCETERTLLTTRLGDVVLSADASPCLAVEVRERGVCMDVIWGADLGMVVVGGRDTCQTLVKVDADGCRSPCSLAQTLA